MDIPHLGQNPNLHASQKTEQQLSFAMQQALHALQLPVLELADWMRIQIDQNPLLEYIEEGQEEYEIKEFSEEKEIDFEKSDFEVLERLDELFEKEIFPESKTSLKKDQTENHFLASHPSLFEYLMSQARETFDTEEDLRVAEFFIGNLDERGFLSSSQEEEKLFCNILSSIQSFDPPGIAAKNLQDSLLIQLKIKGKENKLCYQLIEKHFDDLLHNRLQIIKKKIKCSFAEIKLAIQNDIAPLDLHPGHSFSIEPIQPIVVDLILEKQESHWIVDVNESPLPQFAFSSSYEKLFSDKSLVSEEKKQLQAYASSGKWLKNVLSRRHKTLKEIAELLLKKQNSFFNGNKKELIPLTMQEIAGEIGLHESTIARAVSNKYISSPQGILPLRSFFTSAVVSSTGEKISSQTIKQVLAKIIQEEDKAFPLSDQLIADKIHRMGLPCARRTVTKYRQAMKIAPATQRRKWH